MDTLSWALVLGIIGSCVVLAAICVLLVGYYTRTEPRDGHIIDIPIEEFDEDPHAFT
jgi:hypothetical protein